MPCGVAKSPCIVGVQREAAHQAGPEILLQIHSCATDLVDVCDDGDMIAYDAAAPNFKPLVAQKCWLPASIAKEGDMIVSDVSARKRKSVVMQEATRPAFSQPALKNKSFRRWVYFCKSAASSPAGSHHRDHQLNPHDVRLCRSNLRSTKILLQIHSWSVRKQKCVPRPMRVSRPRQMRASTGQTDKTVVAHQTGPEILLQIHSSFLPVQILLLIGLLLTCTRTSLRHLELTLHTEAP